MVKKEKVCPGNVNTKEEKGCDTKERSCLK
jgi:hypothetical protein